MQYTLKGEKNNIEKFLSKVPEKLADTWKLKPAQLFKTITYNYYYLKKIKTPFCVQITYQESLKRYDIIVSPTDSTKITSYGAEKICLDLLKIFITDFKLWALECDIKIEDVIS